MTGAQVILTLKVAVAAVTVLFLASLVALARGNYRLHGRINTVFFVLTVTAVLGLELTVHVLWPHLSDEFFAEDGPIRAPLLIHLYFSVPAAVLMPIMFYTGKTGRRSIHIALAIVFSVLWLGTFVTGVFFLPHAGE
jgi:uncharacterized membrane protein YozB (DUF420 family)